MTTPALPRLTNFSRLAILLAFFMLAGCSTLRSNHPADWVGYTESGEASYYANRHQMQKTASGERYRHELKTAAHRTIPFGARVRVTNVDNGKSVLVKINDRGPFVRGRIIDLSRSAFATIGNPAAGLLDVEIEVVD